MLAHPLSRWFGALLTFGLIAASPVLGADSSTRVGARHVCPGAIDVPLHLSLVTPDGPIAPGSTMILEGTITADVDLSNVQIAVRNEGSVRLLGPPDIAVGQLQQGLRSFQVPVQFQIPRPLGPDRAAVNITVSAENAVTHTRYQKQDGVFAITRGGQFRAAEGAYVTAELKAIRDDLRATLIDDNTADTQTHTAVTMPGDWSATTHPSYDVPPEAQSQQDILRAVGPQVSKPIQPQVGPNRIASGNVTFDGNISWTASDGSVHPAYGTSVTVWESIPPLFIPIPVASQATFVDGNYSMNVFVPPLTTCFVEISTSNTWVQITPTFPLPIPYVNASPLTFDPGGGSTVTWNFVAANTGTGPSLGLHSMVTYEAAFTLSRNGGSALGFFPIQWPGSTGAAFYDGAHINLRPLDRYAYDVMFHEWGHYVQDSFNMENGVGGPHNIGDCIADVHSSKDEGVRMAWSEGWPTYWGTTAQHAFGIPGLGIPTAGDEVYTDTEAGNFSYSLENDSGSGEDGFGRGEDNEIAVQRILWDVVDGNSDNRDAVAYSDQTLIDIWKNTNVETLSQAWGILRGTLSNAQQLSFGAITTDALVGPGPTAPANNAVVSPSANKTFTWAGNVGCPSSYSGDGFSLRFFTPAGTPVMAIGGLGTTTRTITNGELSTLVAAGHNLKWAVEGSNSASPATGPYLGDNRNIVVDNPPVADAGPDQLNVECASHTTTSVSLNGGGSSDPDGDALTYTWSAPGVTFNNIHSATPIGQFSKGTTVVTLTVSDGILSDTDQMTVRVVDTTPPVIACPANITVECNSHCGTFGGVPATDPAIVAFLAGASATDICDASPTVGPDSYPSCFEDGITTINFTATDDDGNASHCSATVHVQDTTPPTIAVSLDRTVLWPPNHKLVTINASVSVADICDPAPTFQLISIVSNEPDNGLGDGDTENDIQGASYGTADTQFQLRSERSGPGSGRKYTITYRAFDHTGNHTDAVVVVRVPHDQSGSAIAADGWNADGSGFAAGAASFAVVIRSVPRTPVDDGTQIDDVQSGGGGTTTPGATDLLFNTRAVDEAQVLVGNGAGALAPLNTYRVDVDGDGYTDLVSFYRVADAQALAAASTPDDGPVGLHYNTRTGGEYLVENIFGLGTPVVLPALGTTTVGGGGHGSGRGTGGVAADGQGQAAADGNAAQALSQPAVLPTAPQDLAPATTELSRVYPNPLRSDATVEYSLAREGNVDLSVYDVRGARVRTLRGGMFGAGRYTVRWDGRDDSGHRLGGGMYFVRLSVGHYSKTLKTAIMP
jgi:hypothetical protein